MVFCSRPCLATRLTTVLANLWYSSSYLHNTPAAAPNYMLAFFGTAGKGSTAPRAASSAVPQVIGRAISTSRTHLAARRPMVGPAPPPAPPAAPIFDKDGKELSKRTKRKVAVVVGYVGTDFHGWQLSTDRGVRTVEGDLETALWKSGAIVDSNYGDLNKIGWGRTSRTDKGVHASKTVAAAKLMYPQETFTEDGFSQFAKDTLNDHLPADVRCFSVCKVPKSFRGRDECTLREYSYYLPKHLLPDEETERKFRSLLTHFVGTHSFHNYASTKGRQLKEVRRRVQASIDKKNLDMKNARQPAGEGGQRGGDGAGAGLREGTPDSIQNASAGDDGGTGGTKRERSKEWRTWRHKKKSVVDQAEEDAWYRKSTSKSTGEGGEAAATEGGSSTTGGGGGAGRAMEVGQSAEGVSSAGDLGAVGSGASGDAVVAGGASVEPAPAHSGEPVPVGDGPTGNFVGGKHAEELVGVGGEDEAVGQEEDAGDAGDHEGYAAGVDAGEGEDVGGAAEEGPAKVLMLRELRTSIYRCEVLDDVVSFQRPGAEKPDEFVRIDIRGKAFVYNQIRLMIGGALCEARGELFPGFVTAALHTPYRIRVPLAPAEGLVLESQAFTRHANALVLDPRDLASVGGTMAKWGESGSGNNMQTTGRLQTLLSAEQLLECDRWRDEHIVPAVADAWVSRDAAELFLTTVQKHFVGRQMGDELKAAIADHMDKLSATEKAAEEKHNKFRLESKERGSTKYKDLLPKNIATQIVCKFRLLPGNKVSAIQRGVAKEMGEGKLPALADNDEILAFIENTGVDELAIAGGFDPAEIVKACS